MAFFLCLLVPVGSIYFLCLPVVLIDLKIEPTISVWTRTINIQRARSGLSDEMNETKLQYHHHHLFFFSLSLSLFFFFFYARGCKLQQGVHCLVHRKTVSRSAAVWCRRWRVFAVLFQVCLFCRVMKLIENFRASVYNPAEFRRFEQFLVKEIERASETCESKCLPSPNAALVL